MKTAEKIEKVEAHDCSICDKPMRPIVTGKSTDHPVWVCPKCDMIEPRMT